ncbi:MAG: alpha-amylase [Thermoplasmata archaeon HGW-Thermoplasmata-1]|nr:MAG: alpha-amylase [Thermoplasmata archaeon HGW-Thermoplasmata-1]
MKNVCFYFQVHQPMRLGRFRAFDRSCGNPVDDYFDTEKNKAIFKRVAERCYYPANDMMLRLIDACGRDFRISYSLSGTFIEQALLFDGGVIDSFRELAKTGCVEFLQETYYHSLAGLYEDQTEFTEQVAEHKRVMRNEIGVTPRVFRNTELIFDNRIAGTIKNLGYEGIVTEGTERILGSRLPNYLYEPSSVPGIKVLLKNYRLSDDVAFRFGDRGWNEYPLFADKYARWLAASPGETINLFMDYETFGEHQWKETGIFGFMEKLPEEMRGYDDLRFATPSECIDSLEAKGRIDAPFAISWADSERDVSACLDNRMQQYAFNTLRDMRDAVLKTGNRQIKHAWRLLQTSDHYYYCSTKFFADGDVHTYFSPYDNPYDAFINYLNVITDLQRLVGY